LPAEEFVKCHKWNPFFEFSTVCKLLVEVSETEKGLTICGKSDNEAGSLKTQGYVKIFRNVSLRPKLKLPIFHKRDALEGFPSEEGIVADEWRTVTATYWKLDEEINEIGEVSNWDS
jgi:hypothetical protein